MTGPELLAALGTASALRVKTRSGRQYDLERDVIRAAAAEVNPFLYGWPVVPKWHRQHGRARWFYAANLEPCPATPDN